MPEPNNTDTAPVRRRNSAFDREGWGDYVYFALARRNGMDKDIGEMWAQRKMFHDARRRMDDILADPEKTEAWYAKPEHVYWRDYWRGG